MHLHSFNEPGIAVIFGQSGGIGHALCQELEGETRFSDVVGISRTGNIECDLENEKSIQHGIRSAQKMGEIRLAIDATGFLHDGQRLPEKNLKSLNREDLLYSFIINALGPCLIMKHLLPVLPRAGKCVFATLSARVGSIGDNFSGGWYGYRASKAALNQFMRTSALELARNRSESICVALHPGTVSTGLSAPFLNSKTNAVSPNHAARNILNVIDNLTPLSNGGFFDWKGDPVPW